MKILKALFLLVCFSAQANEIYYTGKVPTGWDRSMAECINGQCWPLTGPKWPIAIFFNHGRGTGMDLDDHWYTVDLTPFVPEGTRAGGALLGGLMLISSGLTPERCTLDVAIRRPGELTEKPIARVTTDSRRGGIRNTFSVFVPLVANSFELKWTRTTPGAYPDHCNYGLNLSLQQWISR